MYTSAGSRPGGRGLLPSSTPTPLALTTSFARPSSASRIVSCHGMAPPLPRPPPAAGPPPPRLPRPLPLPLGKDRRGAGAAPVNVGVGAAGARAVADDE